MSGAAQPLPLTIFTGTKAQFIKLLERCAGFFRRQLLLLAFPDVRNEFFNGDYVAGHGSLESPLASENHDRMETGFR